MDNPSQAEANAALRVLSGKPLKYTIRVHKPDGSIIEWQSDKYPQLDWNTEDRHLWLKGGEYGAPPVMRWEDGMIILSEENPKP